MDLRSVFQIARNDVTACAEHLLRVIGRGARAKYPFGNPVSIERRHVHAVKSRPYHVAEKTDGVRACLIACTDTHETPLAMLWDRCGRVYGLSVVADGALFQGSVFDAEVVTTRDGHHRVLVFDVAMLDGNAAVARLPYSKRLEAIARVFPHQLVQHADREAAVRAGLALSGDPTVQLLAKRVYPLQQADACAKSLATLDHASDGFVLTPEEEEAPAPGTAWGVLKIKAAHTVDLLWSQGSLWYAHGSDLQMLPAQATPDLPACNITISDALARVPSGTVVEMLPVVGVGGVTLSFVQARTDRDVPNNLVCLQRTLVSSQEAVTLADVAPFSFKSP